MMIFARRSIQRFINRLSETLPQEPVEELVRKLNRKDRASLSSEWEAAVLFALTSIGRIDYERAHGGTRHADVTFRLPGQGTVSFIADVTTVSDTGLEDENPIPNVVELPSREGKVCGLVRGISVSS